jgi:two-component system CheB/CheR fusion protein
LTPESFVVHIVDPDAAIADGLATLLRTYDIDVVAYPDAETFLQTSANMPTSAGCLLIEADLPGVSGPALLDMLKGDCAELPVLIMVSTSSPGLIEAATHSGRVRVIEKPCVDDALVSAILRIRQQAA